MVSILGHRGAPTIAPENTIAAFVGAAQLGADGVELDVRRSADGALVVHHDETIPGVGPVAELTVAALPDHVPLLEAALDACHGLLVNIEIKNSPIEPAFDPSEQAALGVVHLLHQRRGVDRVVVSSFHLPTIDVVHGIDPGVATALITLAMADPAWVVGTAAAGGHGAVHPQQEGITAALMAAAATAGLLVRAWTVDEPARLLELAGWGVDAVITNDVAAAVATLRPRPAPPPPPPPPPPTPPPPPPRHLSDRPRAD